MTAPRRTLRCTKCGAPLEVRSPRAKTVACASCGALVDPSSPDLAVLGTASRDYVVTPLHVGLESRGPEDQRSRVIGHLRYTAGRWYWDEFLVLTAKGEHYWIQYDEGAFSRFTPRRITEPLAPPFSVIVLNGKHHHVRESGEAQITHISGELTWRARIGDLMHYADANQVAVEWNDDEVELFDVERLTRGRIVETFAITKQELDAGCYTIQDDDDDEDAEERLHRMIAALPRSQRITANIVFWLVVIGVLALLWSIEERDDCDPDVDPNCYRRGSGRIGSYGK